MLDLDKLETVREMAFKARLSCPDFSLNYVPGEGDNVQAFIIGEAPGAAEDIMRRPFVGKSAVLRQLMSFADLNCEIQPNAWLTNVVKFRPPSNRTPTEREIMLFRESIVLEWQAVGAPSLIVPVGSVALQAITGKKISILRAAGKCHKYDSKHGKTLNIWPMVHPAFGLRGGEKLQELLEEDWVNLGKWRHKNAA
ncbi:MAG TPA: uracil-DNA glycosylase [Candidatus Eisenbacteria bacterium]|nr:uracil-DNA glycosylase [Candidatus Eisenbacteria bacterium]